MWMDHRAKEEADHINHVAAGNSVLDFVGGRVSVEMQTPKILWMKKHMPDVYAEAKHFLDLPDFLTWKATGGVTTRSICNMVCKWTYEFGRDGVEKGWNGDYFRAIGLGDLAEDNFTRMGHFPKR